MKNKRRPENGTTQSARSRDCESSRRKFLKATGTVAAVGLAASVGAATEKDCKLRDCEIVDISAVSVARLLRRKKLSPTELIQIAIARIEQVNPKINAIVHFPVERALREAKLAETRIASGQVDWNRQPLTGVPITIKDSLDVQGMPTTSGVPKFANNIANQDATVVRRLRAAGAIVVGKTNLPALLSAYETGNGLFGVTNNPYDVGRTSGGSSGGEGAIVASGGSWLGIGSDGLGSIRVPAHCCGIAGLRPGWGRVSRGGHFPPPAEVEGGLPDPGLLTVGPMARSVEDLQLALSLIQGDDPRDPNTFSVKLRDYRKQRLRGLKVAVWTVSKGAVLTTETAATIENAAEALRGVGVTVTKDKPPLADDIYDISQAIYAPYFLDEWEETLKGHGVNKLDPIDIDMIEGLRAWKDGVTDQQATAFQKLLPELKRGLLRFLQEYDAVISPVVTNPAPKHATTFDDIRSLVFVQLPAYVPAIPAGTVRCGASKGDDKAAPLPIGVQVFARQFREDVVLTLLSTLEQQLGGWQPPPC